MPNAKLLTSLIGNYVDSRIPVWFAETKQLPDAKETIFNHPKVVEKLAQCGELLCAFELVEKVNDPYVSYNAWMDIVFRLIQLKKVIEHYENGGNWDPVSATAWMSVRYFGRLFGKVTGVAMIEDPQLLNRINAAIAHIFKSYQDEKNEYFSKFQSWVVQTLATKHTDLKQQEERLAGKDKQTDLGFAGIELKPAEIKKHIGILQSMKEMLDTDYQVKCIGLVAPQGLSAEMSYNAAHASNILARFKREKPKYTIPQFNGEYFYMPAKLKPVEPADAKLDALPVMSPNAVDATATAGVEASDAKVSGIPQAMFAVVGSGSGVTDAIAAAVVAESPSLVASLAK